MYIQHILLLLLTNLASSQTLYKVDDTEYYIDNFNNHSSLLIDNDEYSTAELNVDISGYKYAINGLPLLHSNLRIHEQRGSLDNNYIFLDFDGHNHTRINNGGWFSFNALPYDPERNDPAHYSPIFNKNEQLNIINIWQRVSEDFAIFNVDVTTEEPDFSKFNKTIAHCLITFNRQINGNFMPSGGADGIAYVNIFGRKYNNILSPALVYWNNIGKSRNIAETVSHELGHNFGLHHDGYVNEPFHFTYYSGNTSYDAVDSWAPIMGIAYDRRISQWNNGDYVGANNFEDDIAKLGNRLGFVADDYPEPFNINLELVSGSKGLVYTKTIEGLINSKDDIDTFKLNLLYPVNLHIHLNPFKPILGTGGYNLHIGYTLYSSSDIEIISNTANREAFVNENIMLGTGEYYINVYGTGNRGRYSAYGSVGYYNLTVMTTYPKYLSTTTTTTGTTTTPFFNRVLQGNNNIMLVVKSYVNCSDYNLYYYLNVLRKDSKKITFILKKNVQVLKNGYYVDELRKIAKKSFKRANMKRIGVVIPDLNVDDEIKLYIKGVGQWELTYYTDYLNQITSC